MYIRHLNARRTYLDYAFIGVIAFLTYVWSLQNGLTGRDLPDLLFRFRSATIPELLTLPLVEFLDSAYRPFSALSFKIEYQLFGLNAFPYHLTDLLIHAAVALCTYSFVRVSLPNRKNIALLAGLVMALHPAAVEVVPNITHRMDSLATLFSLLTLIAVVIAQRAPGPNPRTLWLRPSYGASLVFFLLAVLSKEIGFVTAPLVAAYLFSKQVPGTVLHRALRTFAAVLPFIVVSVVLLILRARVLGSVAGIAVSNPFAPSIGWLKELLSDFVTFLWFLLFPQATVPSAFNDNQFFNFLAANKLELFLLCIMLASFAFALRFKRQDKLRVPSPFGPALPPAFLALLAVWVLLPFIIFALSTLRIRYVYFVLPPFSILLALFLSALYRIFSRRKPQPGIPGPSGSPFQSARVAAAVGLCAALLYLVLLLSLSPLLRPYPAFRLAGEQVTALLTNFRDNAAALRQAPQVLVAHYPDHAPNPLANEPQIQDLRGIWIPAYYRLLTDDAANKWCITSIVKTPAHFVPFSSDLLPNGDYQISFAEEPGVTSIAQTPCCDQFFCK